MPLELKIAVAAVFVQVALTFYSIIRMGWVRLAALKQPDLTLGDIALSTTAYPEDVRKHGNNLGNQFETPILFYAAVGFAAVFQAASMVLAAAAVGYVVSRLAHRMVHVRGNDVRQRFIWFLIGVVMLAIIWLALGLALIGIL